MSNSWKNCCIKSYELSGNLKFVQNVIFVGWYIFCLKKFSLKKWHSYFVLFAIILIPIFGVVAYSYSGLVKVKKESFEMNDIF